MLCTYLRISFGWKIIHIWSQYRRDNHNLNTPNIIIPLDTFVIYDFPSENRSTYTKDVNEDVLHFSLMTRSREASTFSSNSSSAAWKLTTTNLNCSSNRKSWILNFPRFAPRALPRIWIASICYFLRWRSTQTGDALNCSLEMIWMKLRRTRSDIFVNWYEVFLERSCAGSLDRGTLTRALKRPRFAFIYSHPVSGG